MTVLATLSICPGLEGVGGIDAIGAHVAGVAIGESVVSIAGMPGT